jgi:MraZ protein
MFLGEYKHTLDEKGRITVPARYRQLLAEGGYITQGFDSNLMVLTIPVFENLSRRVNEMSLTNPHVRELRRVLFSKAQKIEPDKSGRILIPPFLREEFALNGEVMVIGGGAYFELWSLANWDQQMGHLRDVQGNAQYFSELDLFAQDEI